MIRRYEVVIREPFGGTDMKLYIELVRDEEDRSVKVYLIDSDGVRHAAKQMFNR